MTFENSIPVAPAPVGTSDKALMILSHLSAILGVGFVLPFIVWLVKKNDSDSVALHAKEALNFHISLLIYCICSAPLAIVGGLGVVLIFAVLLFGFVCAIIAAIKASDGILYRYPLTIRLIG